MLPPYLVTCAKDKTPDQYIFAAEPGKPHWRDWLLHNVHRICDLA